jgi:hypothetical protein
MARTKKNNNTSRKRVATIADVKQIIRGQAEIKRYVLLSTGNSNTTTGNVINLSNGIVQGDDITNRAGDQIRMIRHQLHVRGSAITVNQTFRFIWFKDNTNRGTTPSVIELLNSASYFAQYNPVTLQQSRFTILGDLSLDCSINGESIKSKMLNRKGKLVSYNGATAVAGSNGPGAVFVLVIGDSLTGLYDIAYEAHYTDL